MLRPALLHLQLVDAFARTGRDDALLYRLEDVRQSLFRLVQRLRGALALRFDFGIILAI
ncbi:MAG: hypothetical protein ACLTOP_05325 [Collinsella phocaeensis]